MQTIPRCENGFTNDWLGWSYAEFVEKALPQMQRWARGEDLPAGFVPESFYFLWDGEQIVGHCRIRHRLTAAPFAAGATPRRPCACCWTSPGTSCRRRSSSSASTRTTRPPCASCSATGPTSTTRTTRASTCESPRTSKKNRVRTSSGSALSVCRKTLPLPSRRPLPLSPAAAACMPPKGARRMSLGTMQFTGFPSASTLPARTECGPHRGPPSPSAEKPSRRLRGGPFL